MKDYSYHFNNIQVRLGDSFVDVSGTAKYQIEDLGTSDSDSALVAFFYDAKIRDYDTESEDPITGLTKQDLEILAEMVLEVLNDDYELCTNLAINPKN
jgi:hypothetical protein